jgi:acyl carrier protein
MIDDRLRQAVLDQLGEIAPEIDLATVEPTANLREEYDLDSMDFLNFVIGLHQRLGIDIPEADYSRLTTLSDCVAYLSERAFATPPQR